MATKVKLSKSSDIIKNLDSTSQSTFIIDSSNNEILSVGTILFGNSTVGDVGLRNNLGVMQYKNTSDVWRNIGSGGGGGGSVISGNGCLKYATHKLGSQSDDSPVNTEYTLSTGSFLNDGTDLIVFVNGLEKSFAAGDYVFLSSSSLQLVSPLRDTDRLDIYVFSTWVEQSGLSQIGYQTHKVGLDSDDPPTNALFSLSSGSFKLDGSNLIVFVNGALKTLEAVDYTIESITQIKLVYPLGDGDRIDIYVSGITSTSYETHKIGSDADDFPANSVYSLSSGTFKMDGSNLRVFTNGMLKTLEANDYTLLSSTQISLLSPLDDGNRIDMFVDINTLGEEVWQVVTGPVSVTKGNGYICDNAITRVELTLPSVAPVGSRIRVAGLGAAGWQVTCSSGDTIKVGNTSTTSGGNVQSSDSFDALEIVCIVADSAWLALSVVGSLTIN